MMAGVKAGEKGCSGYTDCTWVVPLFPCLSSTIILCTSFHKKKNDDYSTKIYLNTCHLQITRDLRPHILMPPHVLVFLARLDLQLEKAWCLHSSGRGVVTVEPVIVNF